MSANQIDELTLERALYLKKLELFLMIDFDENEKHAASMLTANQDEDDQPAPEFEYHGYLCPQMDELLGDSLYRHQKLLFYESQTGCGNDAIGSNSSMSEENLEFGDLQVKGNRENQNLVARIFLQFRLLHKYILDEYPTLQKNYLPLDYVTDQPAKSALPRTLNIQYHVQVSHRKLLKFNARLRRILNANANFENPKHKECNNSLELLENLTNDLSFYKDIEFRHRDFKFISDEMTMRAENMEPVIERINEKIRETHHSITAFGWEMSHEDANSMEMKQKGEASIDLAMQLAAADANELKLSAVCVLDGLANLTGLFDDLLVRSEHFNNNYSDCNSVNVSTNASTLQLTNYVNFCANNGLLAEKAPYASSLETPNVKFNLRTCKPMHNFG